MQLSEFHLMVNEAMNLQSDLAKGDGREDASADEWFKEFTQILKEAVDEEEN